MNSFQRQWKWKAAFNACSVQLKSTDWCWSHNCTSLHRTEWQYSSPHSCCSEQTAPWLSHISSYLDPSLGCLQNNKEKLLAVVISIGLSPPPLHSELFEFVLSFNNSLWSIKVLALGLVHTGTQSFLCILVSIWNRQVDCSHESKTIAHQCWLVFRQERNCSILNLRGSIMRTDLSDPEHAKREHKMTLNA